MPWPDGEEDQLTQAVYPYAEGGPVTYTEAGQDFFEVERTRGGWSRAPEELTRLLTSQGLPRGPGTATKLVGPEGSNGAQPSWLLPTVTIGALAGIVAIGLRRRVVAPETR